MVEFMYCGETTIPYQLLSPLLTATKTFKVGITNINKNYYKHKLLPKDIPNKITKEF